MVGNSHADIWATDACKIFDVKPDLADLIFKRINNLKLVQKRLASIICHHLHGSQNSVIYPVHPVALPVRLNRTVLKLS